MKDETGEHGTNGNIGNRCNWFRTNVEPNVNCYFNNLINFYEPFETRIVRETTGFYFKDHKMKYYEFPCC